MGEHNLYRLKTEVAVNSVGLAIHSSKARKKSIADRVNLLDNLKTYLYFSQKSFNGTIDEDYGHFQNEYPNHWRIVADNGYQSLLESCHIVLPKKKQEMVTFS